MFTQWKKFSDEMPKEGAAIVIANKSGFPIGTAMAWHEQDRLADEDYWWRIWEPPPKELSAREEALANAKIHPVRPVKDVFSIGWRAACEHIEKRISSLKCTDEICYYCQTSCTKITKEAKE